MKDHGSNVTIKLFLSFHHLLFLFLLTFFYHSLPSSPCYTVLFSFLLFRWLIPTGTYWTGWNDPNRTTRIRTRCGIPESASSCTILSRRGRSNEEDTLSLCFGIWDLFTVPSVYPTERINGTPWH